MSGVDSNGGVAVSMSSSSSYVQSKTSTVVPKATISPFSSLRKISRRKLLPRKKKCNLFSTLPIELRLIIWEFALPEGCVHELHPSAKLALEQKMIFRSNHSKPPALLSVCQESRKIALLHYQLMTFHAPSNQKTLKPFYFNPVKDTLFLNTLVGLYLAYLLLDGDIGDDGGLVPLSEADNKEEMGTGVKKGVLGGWQNVAMDADRTHLLELLAGRHGHPTTPHFKKVFPDLRRFTIAFDFTSKGVTRFRNSVWPGENGTTMKLLYPVLSLEFLSRLSDPIEAFTRIEFGGEDGDDGKIPIVQLARVHRKRYLRGDLRYAVRKTCSILNIPLKIYVLLAWL